MYTDGKIWLGQSADKNIYLLPQMANRHGLISGATGTGKTITMKVLAESFSAMGVPVFFSDGGQTSRLINRATISGTAILAISDG